MIFGLLGGLLGGLGKIGTVGRLVGGGLRLSKSLIGGGLGGVGNLGTLAGLGNLAVTLGRYRTSERALAYERMYGGITGARERTGAGMQAADMLSGAIGAYGRMLEGGARAGGVMPNYYSGMWDRVAGGMREYDADLGTAEYNIAAREYGYAARRAANRMQLYGAWSDAMFDWYDDSRARKMVSPRVSERPLM
jgi:hypothetical protein